MRTRCLLLVFFLVLILPLPAIAQESEPTPDVVATLIEKGLDYFYEGDFEASIISFDAALETDPYNPVIFYFRGQSYYAKAMYAEAIDDFTNAIELDPTDVAIYQYRGAAHEFMGNFEAALADYERMVEIEPLYASGYVGRGNVYFNLRQYELAIEAYNRAIELNPGNATTFSNRALTYWVMNNFEQARADYTRSIGLNPEIPDVYLSRAYINDYLGFPDQAASDYWQYIQLIETERVEKYFNYISERYDMTQGRVYHLLFDAEAGTPIDVWAYSDSELVVDPIVVLLDPAGNPLIGNDDFGDLESEINDYILPETGLYTLVLSHAYGGSEGKISVVKYLELGPEVDYFRESK